MIKLALIFNLIFNEVKNVDNSGETKTLLDKHKKIPISGEGNYSVAFPKKMRPASV